MHRCVKNSSFSASIFLWVHLKQTWIKFNCSKPLLLSDSRSQAARNSLHSQETPTKFRHCTDCAMQGVAPSVIIVRYCTGTSDAPAPSPTTTPCHVHRAPSPRHPRLADSITISLTSRRLLLDPSLILASILSSGTTAPVGRRFILFIVPFYDQCPCYY